MRRVRFFGFVWSVVVVVTTWLPAEAQVTRDAPAPAVRNYEQILRRLEAADARVRGVRGANGLPNIMLAGYWPPTNDMIRQFSDNPFQNPGGWAGENWEGRGYNIYAFFPEFPDGPSGEFPACAWGKGVGDLEVDYQDTASDFPAIAEQIEPVAILTFSRGFPGSDWELEFVQRNLETWINDYEAPFQPLPAPPDNGAVAGYTRCSTLPTHDIVGAVDDAGLGLDAHIDFNGFGGGFLSEFMAYQGTWHHGLHSASNDPARTLVAGHVHVGFDACEMDLTNVIQATEETLRTVIDHLDNANPEIVGDRCPTCCLGAPTGTSWADSPTQLDVQCSITSQSCCSGTDEPYKMRCTNQESFDVNVEWNLCNDNDDCSFEDSTDVSFSTSDVQECDAFGCGSGSVTGTGCGCARSGTTVVPAESTLDVFLDIQCPSWSPLDYGCGADSCCVCMQGLEDECAASSDLYADGGGRACARLDWFAASNGPQAFTGLRQLDTMCMTLADCPGDADPAGPGEAVFPLVLASPIFEVIPPGGSAMLLFQVTNAAVDERQFDFELSAVNTGGVPRLFSFTTLSGVASSSGDGTSSVSGQLSPIGPNQTLLMSVQVDGVPQGVFFENEIFLEVVDPLAPFGVTVSASWAQSASPGTDSGEVPPDLLMDKAGGDVLLLWNDSCLAPTDDDYSVYEGQLSNFASHVPAVCSTGGLTEQALIPISSSAYYLVVPTNGAVEGSYGTESGGLDRPPSLLACRSQSVVACE